MPKDTFNNLNEEKKEKILSAAVNEFSAKRFSEASINQIVKDADIPRGSFYQYFSSKEDIYAYMAGEIAKEQSVVQSFIEPPKADADAFGEFMYKARAAVELYMVRPKYRQIALLMEKDDSEFISGLRSRSELDMGRIKELLERDKRRGLIKPNVDPGLAAEMLYSLTIKELYRAGQDGGMFLKRISDIIGIIKEGIDAGK
jgi:TetR/AcrR family transcriptional regulator